MKRLLEKITKNRLPGSIAGMVLICFLMAFSAVAFDEKDLIKKATTAQDVKKLHQLILQYQDYLVGINQEMVDLQENLEWLGLKIKTMEDAKRHVPESMEQSMVHKRSRINVLSKAKSRYEDRIKDLTALADQYLKASMLKSDDRASAPEDVYLIKDKKELFQKELRLKMADSGLIDWVELVDDGGCCRLETRLPILFPSGRAEISSEYKPFLKSLAQLVKGYDVRIFVGGFADIDGIHNKKYASNFELGALRAASVVHELVKYGVKPSVFQVGSTGRYRFKAKGMSTKKALERRVDLSVVFAG